MPPIFQDKGQFLPPLWANKGQILPPILKIRGNFCPLFLFHALIGCQNHLCRIRSSIAFYDLTPEYFITQDAPHIIVGNLYLREVPFQ